MAPTSVALRLATARSRSARATFARNFFEAGGIEALANDGFESRDALLNAFTASGARLACLCAADADYARAAADTARALKEAGARALYLAGPPGEHEDAWRTAGIDTFIHSGSDALAVLQAAHQVR